jgi:hypothetical protein
MSGFGSAFKVELFCQVSIVFWAVWAVFIIIVGPFGSYDSFSLATRILVALPALAVLMAISLSLRVLIYQPMEKRGDHRIAALATAFVAGVVLGPVTSQLLTLASFAGHLTKPTVLELALLIMSISLGHSALRYEPRVAHPLPETETELAHRLLHRLPPEQRGQVFAVSGRDHYVDVQTGQGTASLLLRFADAVAELNPTAGGQVHRSHWVAWDAIVAVEREGVRLFLMLKHGQRVPVSKNHREKLEQRGLI